MTQLVEPHLTVPPSPVPPLPPVPVDGTQPLPLIVYPGRQLNAQSPIELHVDKAKAGAGGHAAQAAALQPFTGISGTHAPLHRFWFVPQGASPPLPPVLVPAAPPDSMPPLPPIAVPAAPPAALPPVAAPPLPTTPPEPPLGEGVVPPLAATPESTPPVFV